MQLEGPTAAGLMYSDTGGDGPVVVLLLHPLPTGARHHGGTSRKRLRYTDLIPPRDVRLLHAGEPI